MFDRAREHRLDPLDPSIPHEGAGARRGPQARRGLRLPPGARAIVTSALLLGACKPEAPTAAPEARSCRDACGEGTRFAASQCVIDWDAGICVSPEQLEALQASRDDWTECPVHPGALPPFRKHNVKKIPGYDRSATRVQSMSGGTEQLDEYAIETFFGEFEAQVYDCLTVAACYAGGHPGTGTLRFEIGVRPDGSITGINLDAPKALRRWGVDNCAKKALWEHGFRSYDGEAEGIVYEMEIGGYMDEAG